MPTAVLITALIAGLVCLVGLLATIAVVIRSLAQTSRAVGELGQWLVEAETRLGSLHEQMAMVGDDLGDVAAMMSEHAPSPDREPTASVAAHSEQQA